MNEDELKKLLRPALLKLARSHDIEGLTNKSNKKEIIEKLLEAFPDGVPEPPVENVENIKNDAKAKGKRATRATKRNVDADTASNPEPEPSTSAVAQPRATRSRKAKGKTVETPKEPATDAAPAKAPAKSAQKKPAGRAATKAPAKGRKKRATVAESEAPEAQRSPSPPIAQPEVDIAQPEENVVQPEVSARVEPEPIPPQPATATASTSVPAAAPDDARPPSPPGAIPHPSPVRVTHPSPVPVTLPLPAPALAPPSAPLTPTPQAESSRAAQLREVSDAGPINESSSPVGNGTTSPLPPKGRSVRLQSPPRTAPSAPGEQGPSTAPRQEGEGLVVPSSRQVQRMIDECKKLGNKVNELVEDAREVEQLLEATDMIMGETLAEIAVSQMERRDLEEKMKKMRNNLELVLEPKPKPVDRKGKRRARDEDDDEYEGGGGGAGRPSRKTPRLRS